MSSEWSEFTQSWDTPDDAQAAWPISALLITNSSELIYAGDTSGRLTTYTLGRPGEALERYTSFLCAHTAIRRMHALGRSTSGSVLVQTDDSVQVRTRGGAKAFGKSTTPNEPFTASAVSGLEAFVCTAAGGGTLLDIERGSVVRRAAVDASAVAADLNGACLTLATAQGLVVCRDARAGLGVAQTARAFPGGGAVDMVRNGARIFVCGTGPDPANAYRLLALPTVRVFDVRNLAQPLEDIDCGDGAAPVRLWAGGDDLWICHDSGYVETRSARDAWTTPGDAFAEPALSDYAYASAFCVAPTGDAALVADTDGVLHVWAAGEAPRLSEKAALRDGDFDCSAEMPALGVDFDCDSVSLMCVEMPAARAPLLSWMDGERLYDVGRPARFVDAGVLGSLRQMDGVGYVANPRTARRNQQVFGRAWRQRWGDGAQDDGELTLGRSKFLSQQRRRTHASPQQPDAAELPPVPESQAQQPQQQQSQPPKQLQRMRISYSRFGVEDFDFSLYNATAHSGLEGGRDNAYANALLQTLFRSPELRSVVLAHSAGDCTEPQCLSCQMGFLFRSLETAAGASCHATQLLHVLADRPEAAALALLEDEHGNPASGTSYAVLAQRLLRFLLEQASGECAGLTAGANGRAVERIVGFAQDTHTACPQCHAMRSRSSHVFAADLDPPQGTSGLATLLAGGSVSVRRAEMLRSGRRTGILALIEQALARSETTRAWCPECRSFQLLQTEKHMTQAPAGYFALNFPVIEPSADAAGGSSGSGSGSGSGGGAWQTSLPAEFRLVVGGAAGKRVSVLPACGESPATDDAPSTEDSPATNPASISGPAPVSDPTPSTFRLVAVVSSIRDTVRGPEHLVVHVRGPDSASGSGWLLLNDFLVQPVAEDRVLSLHDWWRTPSLALYANSDRTPLAPLLAAIARRHPYKISTRILTHPKSILDRPSSYRRSNNNSNGGGKAPQLRGANRRNEAVPLTRAEAESLESGHFVCALDAEFVVLDAAKMEVFSDGTQELHQPPVHTLARLSVVRANGGPLHGLPFIDDYVAIARPISDLATQYSGIHAGDLIQGSSPYRLSTMKEVYKKLRLLVDSCCVIIGHGLKHDFRVCNIFVPESLQRDTMVLYQSPAHIRPIALKFLYWFFYRKTIQSGEHSSVEDAQATLKVYESYLRCTREDPEGSIDAALEAIYFLGAQTGWKTLE